MADLLLDITIRIDGVPTAADALPVLRDAADTYGVRRADTHAVVVAAGTAMSAGTGTGNYVFTLPDAEGGVTYDYVVEATVGGSVVRYPGQRTIAIASELPSYFTDAAEVRALAAGLYGMNILAQASDADVVRAAAHASGRVDASSRWQGRRYNEGQALEFPRMDGRKIVGLLIDSPGGLQVKAPINVRLAVVFETNSLLAGQRDARLAAQHDGLASQSIGDAAESYVAPTNSRGVPVLCKEAHERLSMYRLRSGRLL